MTASDPLADVRQILQHKRVSKRYRREWDRRIDDALQSCVGATIVEATVMEMGLYGPDDAPIFSHPAIPFIQASTLELMLACGKLLHIANWQDDDQFALLAAQVDDDRRLDSQRYSKLWRHRTLRDFPLGKIELAQVQRDERGDWQEIRISVDGKSVILKAGEVYENIDGTLTVLERDESVLVFLNPTDFEGFKFNVPLAPI